VEGEGELNHPGLQNFSHLFIPGLDIFKKKKNPKRPLSKLREGVQKGSSRHNFTISLSGSCIPIGKRYLGLGSGAPGCFAAGEGM